MWYITVKYPIPDTSGMSGFLSGIRFIGLNRTRRAEMEIDLKKYITLEDAAKEDYITASMIELLCVWKRIPYFRNIELVLVNPEDIKSFLASHWEEMVTGRYIETRESDSPIP